MDTNLLLTSQWKEKDELALQSNFSASQSLLSKMLTTLEPQRFSDLYRLALFGMYILAEALQNFISGVNTTKSTYTFTSVLMLWWRSCLFFPSLSSQVFWFNGVKPFLQFKMRH